MGKTFKVILTTVAILGSVTPHAASLTDKTGLISLKNEGATRGSCEAVSINLSAATNNIAAKIDHPGASVDETWKNSVDADQYRQYGHFFGPYVAQSISDGISYDVPTSQVNNYLASLADTEYSARLLAVSNPYAVLDAFNYCAETFHYLKKSPAKQQSTTTN
ncbi:hypothetical protein [Polynucleobacter sphagniphilus]|uniref:hypothetical protein n=1 Tax=Polynucleobacter sphagniphilus TaxID=1743169 RepID=UPI00247435EB|nr:hypothetical protein [Polynucleobacter sphagniphilus]MDH6524608.1 hypothetical protein [Polynucleobacter sphagniphilus]